MTNLGTTYSTEKPNAIEITDKKVFVAENIQPYEIEQDFGVQVSGYQFNLTEYDKDEYILLMAQRMEKIDSLEDELAAAKILLGVD